jgi:serine/threonine protein kinase
MPAVRPVDDEADFEAPLLLGRYQPLQLLARGGSAMVFRARDETLGRNVAIKHFNGFTENDLAAFHAEVQVLAKLNHHGVVAINDVGTDLSSPEEPHPFLVMEFVTGTTLRETIAARRLSTVEIGELGFEIAEALEYVHAQGVIHRDISPSNIMIVHYNTSSSRPRARLTDFGIAIAVGTREAPGSPTVGTAAYLSPEQTTDAVLTPASDIYSLGLVLLECFTRERAFPGSAIDSAIARREVDPPIPASVPATWRAIIQESTRRDPAERPSAAELAKDIRIALRHSGRHT